MKSLKSSNLDIIQLVGTNSRKILSTSSKIRKLGSEVQAAYQPVFWEEGEEFPQFHKYPRKISVSTSKFSELVTLLGLSYYMDPKLSSLIRIEIIEKVEKNRDICDILLGCFNRKIFFTYLFTSTRFNDRQVRSLFSEKNLVKFLDSVVLRLELESPLDKSGIIPPQQHKGYRDHGTLPSVSDLARKKVLSEDWNLINEQIEIEEYRDNIGNYLSCNYHWLASVASSLLSENYYFNKKKGVIFYEKEFELLKGKNQLQRGTSGESEEEEGEPRYPDFQPGEKGLSSEVLSLYTRAGRTKLYVDGEYRPELVSPDEVNSPE